MRTDVARSFALLGFLLSAASCSSSEADVNDVARGPKRFGQACAANEECLSLVCVDVGGGRGVCSRVCEQRADCPEAPNWQCAISGNASVSTCGCIASGDQEVCGDGIDNDCNSKVDDCLMCGGQPVPPDDPRHCGKCDNACRKDQSCVEGVCVCPGGETECAGVCADLANDDQHCGACGTPCPAAQQCAGGKCGCPDPSRAMYCAGTGCVDSASDEQNCGACGNACPIEQVCDAGVCQCPSALSPDFCEGGGCVDLKGDPSHCGSCGKKCEEGLACENGACKCPYSGAPDFCDAAGCVSLESDPANCGQCGTSCAPGQGCQNGVCTCPAGQPDFCAGAGCVDMDANPLHCGSCGNSCNQSQQCVGGQCTCPSHAPQSCLGECVNPSDDPEHCGACGNKCGVGQYCKAGHCTCQEPWLTACGTACVDFQADEANCGGCAQQCAGGESCFGGQCSCPSGLLCSGVCVSSSDPMNCGACNHVCPSAQVCASGQCQCPGAGMVACGSACVNSEADTANCGACGIACKPGEQCNAGTCECPAGTSWCTETGTCTNLASNSLNCGVCGNACPDTQSCLMGSCVCPDVQQKYCASEGKCVNTSYNAQHCGTCDAACPVAQSCVSGKCQCPQAGQAWCASADACVATSSDSSHCGGCDKACPPLTQCISSVCKCTAAGQTLCGSACADLKTDKANCGKCGSACSGTLVCASGKCVCPPPEFSSHIRITQASERHNWFSVAWSGSRIGVVYTMGSQTSGTLRFAMLNPDGTRAVPQDVELATSSAFGSPDVIWTGAEWGVTWYQGPSSNGTLRLARLSPGGALIAPPVTVSTNTYASAGVITPPRPRLAFMPSQGYAMASLNSDGNRLDFQLLGTDGSQAGTFQHFTVVGQYLTTLPPAIAASSSEWGILAVSNWGLYLGRVNADGTMTSSWTAITPSYNSQLLGNLQLVHDGNTWISAYRRQTCNTVGSVSTKTTESLLARGPSLQYTTLLATDSKSVVDTYCATMAPPPEAHFAIFGDKLAAMWMTADQKLWLRRYTFPSTPSSPLSPLGDAILALDVPTLSGGAFMPVLTDADSVFATWLDTRWGNELQVYGRSADYPECQ